MTKTSKFWTFIIFWPLLPTPIWRNYLSGTFRQVQQLFGYFKAIRIKMHREIIASCLFLRHWPVAVFCQASWHFWEMLSSGTGDFLRKQILRMANIKRHQSSGNFFAAGPHSWWTLHEIFICKYLHSRDTRENGRCSIPLRGPWTRTWPWTASLG